MKLGRETRIALALALATPCLAVQPSAAKPLPAPLRDLEWGQLNILHTTDTHGWLAGHLQEYVLCSSLLGRGELIEDRSILPTGAIMCRSRSTCATRPRLMARTCW